MRSGIDMNAGEGEAIRVLVVDDEVKVASMVGRWLEREGIVVEIATSYREAIEVAERFPCDLVFSDVNMPDGSGLDLARWFKERDATIQVLMITGNTQVEPAIEEIEAEAGRQFDPDVARAAAPAFLGRLELAS